MVSSLGSISSRMNGMEDFSKALDQTATDY
jgi:hypothetical protein